MDKFTKNYVEKFMSELISRNPGESEFHQAVREVVESVADYVVAYPYLMDLKTGFRGPTTAARSISTAAIGCR